MSTATPNPPTYGAPTPQANGKRKTGKRPDFDPDEFRMTVGEHLEDLRRRLFLALLGYVVVLVVCFVYGERVIAGFCAPLVKVLSKHGINEQLVIEEVGEAFMVYIKISMISAAALAAPWILYQAWQFVAAGLYPKERKYITRYLPLSITLLIGGMMFVYFLVLPWTLHFLIKFTVDIVPAQVNQAPTPELIERPGAGGIPVIEGNPKHAYEGMIWIDSTRNQLKLFLKGKVRVLSLRSDNLLAPEITLGNYIDLVVTMLLVFGISFQLPLVVLTLERIGIVELDTLKSSRRYVYFILAIASAIITPGGDIIVMLMLAAPLCGLYELGIWLAKFGRKKELAT